MIEIHCQINWVAPGYMNHLYLEIKYSIIGERGIGYAVIGYRRQNYKKRVRSVSIEVSEKKV